MPRRAEGWRLERDPRNGVFRVRFSFAGRRRALSTGERDPVEAQARGTALYAETVSGRRRADSPGPRCGPQPLDEVAADWLEAVESGLDPATSAQYLMYVRAHFVPFFKTLDRVTAASAADYVRDRLRRVRRRTLLKELSALRGLLAWCVERGHLDEVPLIRAPGKRVTGTPDTRRPHKTEPILLDEGEVTAILRHLPDRSRTGQPRAFFEVLWETSLRPSTVHALRAPDDYRKGAPTLTIRDEADKARFGRELDLTAGARAALDSVVPERGVIFGRHNFRTVLRRAAKDAGLPPEKAQHVSDYDFRHARLTFLAERSPNLPGLAYLAGHKHTSTTSRYINIARRAGREVLEAAVGAEYRSHSGPRGQGSGTVAQATGLQLVDLARAKGGTRTPKSFRTQEPESCASASSATFAPAADFSPRPGRRPSRAARPCQAAGLNEIVRYETSEARSGSHGTGVTAASSARRRSGLPLSPDRPPWRHPRRSSPSRSTPRRDSAARPARRPS